MEDQPKTGKRGLALAGIAGLVALVLGALVLLTPTGATDLATVKPLEPVVRLQRPGLPVLKPISAPTATNQGARIETDRTGMAEIAYFDGSVTRLGVETGYELSTLEDKGDKAIVGDLALGRTFHRVAKLSGSGERFEVRTGNAVAAVRGTTFAVVCLSREECVIGVVEGEVELVSRTTGGRITLRAGEEITVFTDGTFSSVRPLDLEDEWIKLNLGLDEVDVDDLKKRLFGSDRLPATDDDPEPEASASSGAGEQPGDGNENPPAGAGQGAPTTTGAPEPGPPPAQETPRAVDDENPPPCETGYPPRPC